MPTGVIKLIDFGCAKRLYMVSIIDFDMCNQSLNESFLNCHILVKREQELHES